jgi:hypothetical protein
MLAAVGVVSAHNAPLWLRCYSTDEEPHRLHSVLYCALDSVDERLAAGTKARRGPPSGGSETRGFPTSLSPLNQETAPYLGLLSPRDEYLVYGYVSCTRVKLLLAFDSPVRASWACVCGE